MSYFYSALTLKFKNNIYIYIYIYMKCVYKSARPSSHVWVFFFLKIDNT